MKWELVEARTISDKVFLGKDANEGDWQEITLNEKRKNGRRMEKRNRGGVEHGKSTVYTISCP